MKPALLLLALTMNTFAAAPLTVQELPDRALRITNAFTTVELVPHEGGRLRKLVIHKTGDNLLYWEDKEFIGGLLDEKGGWTAAPYRLDVIEKSASQFVVRLTADSQRDVIVSKTLTFRADTPVIHVAYRFENHGQVELKSSKPPLFIRNFIRPAGTNITDDDRYCFPMTDGVAQENTKNLGRHPDCTGKLFDKIAGGWQAFVNRAKQQGLAFVYLDDALAGFYSWRNSDVFPTFEWYYRALPAGQTLETSLLIVPVTGLSAVRYADDQIALNWTADAIEAVALQKPLADVTLQAGHATPIKLGALPVGQAIVVQAVLPADATEFKLSTGARFRDTVKPVSGTIPRAPQPAARVMPLAGWKKAKPFAPPVADGDTKRGFALYTRVSGSAGEPLTELEFDLAPGLRESRVIGLWPVGDVKDVAVRLAPSKSADEPWLARHVQLRLEHAVAPPPNKAGITDPFYQLKPVTSFTPAPDQENRLWLTVHGGGLPAGRYEFALHVGPATVIPVRVTVWPVTLPERPRVNLEMEHCLPLLPGCDYRQPPNVEAITAYVRNLAEHGVTVAQFYPITGDVWGFVKIKGTDKTLAQAWQADKTLFERDRLPDLDFSYFNPWLDIAYAHGLRRLSSNAGTISNTPLPNDRVKAWYLREFHRYAVSRGFRAEDIFMKVMDETPPDRVPVMVAQMKISKDAGWQVFSTYSSIFRYPELTRAVNAVADLWQFGGWPAHEYAARLAAHDVSPAAEMWTYTGWATAARSYQQMRAHGWEVALARLDGFHGHEYYRWTELAAAAIVTIENERPVDSPAWEGIADGISDARLLAELIHRLDGGQNLRGRLADTTGPAAATIAPIAGAREGALLPMRTVPGERGLTALTVTGNEKFSILPRYRQARKAVLEKLAQTGQASTP